MNWCIAPDFFCFFDIFGLPPGMPGTSRRLGGSPKRIESELPRGYLRVSPRKRRYNE